MEALPKNRMQLFRIHATERERLLGGSKRISHTGRQDSQKSSWIHPQEPKSSSGVNASLVQERHTSIIVNEESKRRPHLTFECDTYNKKKGKLLAGQLVSLKSLVKLLEST